VTKVAARLFFLLAVLLMPLGMATAAAPAHHDQPAASMSMEHCPDRAPKHDMQGALDACTMACSAALPAADLSQSVTVPLPYVPVARAIFASLHGIHPDTATPPPKLS